MDHTNLINNITGKTSKIGIIGAIRSCGYTLLAQIPRAKYMDSRVICSRYPEECLGVLKETGYDEGQIILREGRSGIEQTPKEVILIVSNYRLVMECGTTISVECTRNMTVSFDAVFTAFRTGVNMYIVPREADSVCGPPLNQVAAKYGTAYALVNGGQSRNLLDLYSWVMLLGPEAMATGKSSEYGLVWDREAGRFTCTDGSGVMEKVPRMQSCWYYNGVETLNQRRSMLEKYTGVISTDPYEMNLVSSTTRLVFPSSSLSHPVTKTSELANISIPEEDGGILKKAGVTDVLYNLRGKDRTSSCDGGFTIVKRENEKVQEILKSKDHVMSKNDKYACIYYPYRHVGLEILISILLGDLMRIGTHPECRQISVLVDAVERDLSKDTQPMVQDHHHAIDGLIPKLLERISGQDSALSYLLNGITLLRNAKKGDPITLEDVDLTGLETYELYAQGLDTKQNRGDRVCITKQAELKQPDSKVQEISLRGSYFAAGLFLAMVLLAKLLFRA